MTQHSALVGSTMECQWFLIDIHSIVLPTRKRNSVLLHMVKRFNVCTKEWEEVKESNAHLHELLTAVYIEHRQHT